MTASGTDIFAPNRAEIIQDALEMCGRDSSDPETVSSANRTLNALIKALNVNHTDVNVKVRTSFDTVAADGTYTVEALAIDGMIVSSTGDDSPVVPLTQAQYNSITNKAAVGRPSRFCHDKQSGTIYLFPIPDAVYTVTYGRVRQYQDMTDDEQTFDFPSSAMEMLTFGLAHRYSFKAGLDLGSQQMLEAQFEQARKRYLVANSAYTAGQRASTCMVV